MARLSILPRISFNSSLLGTEATPIATTPSQHLQALTPSFFARPAELVAPELIGCLLVKRQPNGELLWGVLVETEAYSQEEPACHGYRRRTPSNETLFAEPGRFYVYVSYGIHHCVNVVALRASQHFRSHFPSHSAPLSCFSVPCDHPLYPTAAAPAIRRQFACQSPVDSQLRPPPEAIHLTAEVCRQQW